MRDAGNTTDGTVIAVVPDLFFSVTVRNAIRSAGYDARMVKAVGDIGPSFEMPSPRLAVIDMGAVRSPEDWSVLTTVKESGVPVLVFGPHKNVEGFRAAKAAGVSRVVSNGQFHADMVGFISRYAAGQSGNAFDGSDDGEEVTE